MSDVAPFDLAGLAASIERARLGAGVSMRELSRQVGVSSSTIRRLAVAGDAEADGVLALVRWLGVAPETFIDGSSIVGRPLHPSGPGMVRVDMDAISALDQGRGRPANRSRTTIQRLAVAAQQSGRPIASFTRWSDE